MSNPTKITFDEICDARDNPGLMSFSEHQRILKGAIELIKEQQREIDKKDIELLREFTEWHNEEFAGARYISFSEIEMFKLRSRE